MGILHVVCAQPRTQLCNFARGEIAFSSLVSMPSRIAAVLLLLLAHAALVCPLQTAPPRRSPEHDAALRSFHQELSRASATPAEHASAMGARTRVKMGALALARQQRRAVGAAATTPLPSDLNSRIQLVPEPASSGIIDATSFADPTGVEDASAGLQRAIEALLKGSGPRQELWANRTDLSGRRLELGGGQYLLNAPLFIPAGYGNFEIRGGTLRAGPQFPRAPAETGNGTQPAPFLLTIGGDIPGYVESVSINSVLLQGDGIAEGGLHCVYCVGVNIGPAVFVEGFPGTGIRVDEGAEVLIHDCWFTGPYLDSGNWSDHNTPPPLELNHSIAIQINGNDHILINSVVWQYTHLGVQINGAATLLQGIHAWGCGSAWCAKPPNPLTGIAIHSGRTRVVDCYLDFNLLDLVDPTEIVVANTFFLGTHTRLLAKDPSHGEIRGLTMTGNLDNSIAMLGNFSSPAARAHIEDDNVPYVPPPGPTGEVKNAGSQLTAVRRSLYSCSNGSALESSMASSRGRMEADAGCDGPQAQFSFNLSDPGPANNLDTLLLPTIDWLQYSVAFAAEETQTDITHHAVLSAGGDVATVVFGAPALATVFLEARCCTGGLQAAPVMSVG